ncbi:hypothetical protein LTR36_011006 [Oleoguttula mirabilis]|uniref:Cytochrome P450 n=1 Tax=Oleoguttula mirabilis TaxID=1507867 RepID=A0AAV9J3X0_9PEZI|nr:hypothetical protein LTR36_011006 [Oleoguttula mirabilis]
MGSYVLTILVSTLLGSLSYAVYLRVFHPLAKVPGPLLASLTRLWLVYQSRTLKRHLIELQLHRKYGRVVRVSPNEIIISDPEYVKMIYGANSPFLKARWYETVGPKDADTMNLLGEWDMKKYALQRRLVGPIFTTPALKTRENLLEAPIAKFLSKMKRTKDEPQDIVKWMNIVALDLLTEITFSESPNYIDRATDDANAIDVDAFWQQIHWMGLCPDLWVAFVSVSEWCQRFGLDLFFKADIAKLSIVQYYIGQLTSRASEATRAAESATTPSNYADLASDIARFAAARPDFKPQWAATITLHIIGAGFDTLGMTLSAAIVHLARTPTCQAALHHELDAARNTENLDAMPKYTQTLALPYLQASIAETTRLTPVIGIALPRTVPAGGASIDGYDVPAGMTVGMNPWVLHRDKRIFGEDADTFRPDRYLRASEGQRHVMEAVSLAFGGASRSCPGRNLAYMCLSKTLAAVFLEFEVEVLGEEEVRRCQGEGEGYREECFFVVKWHGVWVRFRERGQ